MLYFIFDIWFLNVSRYCIVCRFDHISAFPSQTLRRCLISAICWFFRGLVPSVWFSSRRAVDLQRSGSPSWACYGVSESGFVLRDRRSNLIHARLIEHLLHYMKTSVQDSVSVLLRWESTALLTESITEIIY